MANSKIIKCDLAENHLKNLNNKEVTIHNVKPGTLINGNVATIMDNGIEVSFLTGFKGTVFADHLDKAEPTKYKQNEKISCRIIFVDPQTQTISLSMLPHIMKLNNVSEALAANEIVNGKVYENVKIAKSLFGGSYKVSLGNNLDGFLHKIHAVKAIKKKLEDEDQQYEKIELADGQAILKIRVKELNYFDGVPVLSMRNDILSSEALDYAAL